jgi:hypothetical protein
LKIKLTESPDRSQYTGIISVAEVTNSWQEFNVVFSTVAQGNMWLVAHDVITKSDKLPEFAHKCVRNNWRPRFKASKIDRFAVNAFGGTGKGRNYFANTKIGQVSLGSTIVGVLLEIEGFGGEIGDGCVTSCL